MSRLHLLPKRVQDAADVSPPKATSMIWAGVRLMRPRQWTKNGLVFAALLFSGQLVQPASLALTALTFAAFCLASSAAYSLNDALDAASDRLHPRKRLRPVASGLISPGQAVALAVVLGAGAVTLAMVIDPLVGLIVASFLGINVLYSFVLKRVMVLDILTIASGYVLRAVAGAEAISVELSLWFLTCVPLLSLFLAAAKRRHELMVVERAAAHRQALQQYSKQLLDQLLAALSAAVIMAYFLYSMDSTRPRLFMLTSPFVVYGIFRYLYLVYQRAEGGNPDELVVSDLPLLITVASWAAALVVIIYVV